MLSWSHRAILVNIFQQKITLPLRYLKSNSKLVILVPVASGSVHFLYGGDCLWQGSDNPVSWVSHAIKFQFHLFHSVSKLDPSSLLYGQNPFEQVRSTTSPCGLQPYHLSLLPLSDRHSWIPGLILRVLKSTVPSSLFSGSSRIRSRLVWFHGFSNLIIIFHYLSISAKKFPQRDGQKFLFCVKRLRDFWENIMLEVNRRQLVGQNECE